MPQTDALPAELRSPPLKYDQFRLHSTASKEGRRGVGSAEEKQTLPPLEKITRDRPPGGSKPLNGWPSRPDIDIAEWYCLIAGRGQEGKTRKGVPPALVLFSLPMKPWEHSVPPVLYKYLPPERLHVLNDYRVRFSQRAVFEDDHELQPDYAIFGTESEIWRYALSIGFQLKRGGLSAGEMVAAMAGSSRAQKIAIEALQKNVRARDEVGIFCLTEATDSDQMWTEYADMGRGFVVGFDPGHTGFEMLKGRGQLGKVYYSDEPIGSALGSLWNDDAVGALFRKRMKYAFEHEWRCIRMLHRLEVCADGVFLSAFDPASVCEIIIRPECSVEHALRGLVATDARYKDVQIKMENRHASN